MAEHFAALIYINNFLLIIVYQNLYLLSHYEYLEISLQPHFLFKQHFDSRDTLSIIFIWEWGSATKQFLCESYHYLSTHTHIKFGATVNFFKKNT